MRRIDSFVVLSFLFFALAGSGCVKTIPSEPTGSDAGVVSALRPFVTASLTADDVAEIRARIAAGATSARVPATSWSVPDGIDPMQMSQGVSLAEGVAFAFVEQPNLWNPLWHASGESAFGKPGDAWTAVNFAGVLFTRDGGTTWSQTFSIPPVAGTARQDGDLTPFNPMGMFLENGSIWLDVVDDGGAGSGEGIDVRYSSTDGAAWKRTGCYYFNPDVYFDVSKLTGTYTHYGFVPIFPHALEAVRCPAYAASLP